MANPTSDTDTPEPEPDRYAPDEHTRVHTWRLARFLEAGVPYDTAKQLAHAGVDHHQLVQLLNRGCTIDTAVEILT